MEASFTSEQSMKARKKPVVIEAHQWFKNGDHPDDYAEENQHYEYPPDAATRKAQNWEGGVVRYFRRPGVDGESPCSECGQRFHNHGWIDTLEDGHRVCPGDYIITGVAGERYPCKPDIFAATYDILDEAAPSSRNLLQPPLQRLMREAWINWHEGFPEEDIPEVNPSFRMGFESACECIIPAGIPDGAFGDVLDERLRQVMEEGWTPEHDDKHNGGQLALAAACYAVAQDARENYNDYSPPPFWPWAAEWWKPKDYRRDLVRAAALLIAEIERIDRAAEPNGSVQPTAKAGR